MARTKTTFTTETRKNVKNRGKAKKTLMLDAIRNNCGSESEFSNNLIKIALKKEDPTLLMYAFEKIQPKDRSTFPDSIFKYNKESSFTDQCQQIIGEASKGKIPADVAKTLIDTIAVALKIEEYTTLKEDFYKALKTHNDGIKKTDS